MREGREARAVPVEGRLRFSALRTMWLEGPDFSTLAPPDWGVPASSEGSVLCVSQNTQPHV